MQNVDDLFVRLDLIYARTRVSCVSPLMLPRQEKDLLKIAEIYTYFTKKQIKLSFSQPYSKDRRRNLAISKASANKNSKNSFPSTQYKPKHNLQYFTRDTLCIHTTNYIYTHTHTIIINKTKVNSQRATRRSLTLIDRRALTQYVISSLSLSSLFSLLPSLLFSRAWRIRGKFRRDDLFSARILQASRLHTHNGCNFRGIVSVARVAHENALYAASASRMAMWDARMRMRGKTNFPRCCGRCFIGPLDDLRHGKVTSDDTHVSPKMMATTTSLNVPPSPPRLIGIVVEVFGLKRNTRDARYFPSRPRQHVRKERDILRVGVRGRTRVCFVSVDWWVREMKMRNCTVNMVDWIAERYWVEMINVGSNVWSCMGGLCL